MKFNKSLLYGIVVLPIILEICSATLLSGLMMQYLVGSFVVREVIPTIFSTAFRALLSPTTTITSTFDNNGNIVSETSAIKEVAEALGKNRRVNRYMKDLWPELNCSLNPCKKDAKMRDRKDASSEEDDSIPKLTDSEELAGFTIFGAEDDPVELAEEELGEEDPNNFQHILNDHKNRRNERTYSIESQSNEYEDQDQPMQNYEQEPSNDNQVQKPPPNYAYRPHPLFAALNPGILRLPLFFRHRNSI